METSIAKTKSTALVSKSVRKPSVKDLCMLQIKAALRQVREGNFIF